MSRYIPTGSGMGATVKERKRIARLQAPGPPVKDRVDRIVNGNKVRKSGRKL